MKILVIGCGYAGSRIAALHLARGDQVTATARNPGRRKPVSGLEWLALELDAPAPPLPEADRVYYAAPPPAAGRDDPWLKALLERLPPPQRFVYLGSTGVYGDRGGALVDETAPLEPGTDRARRRLEAENIVRAWSERRGVTAAILRIAAIYGPGRLPLDRLRAGKPVPDPADTGPGNRIHVDDLANAALAVADSGRSGAWNVSDGHPMSIADFTDYVADLAGLPRPRRVPLASPEISPGMRSFLRETRRIDNRKLLALPGFRLLFPDPRDGIRQSISK
ncbi:MAG TPA: SDR family oxidoreductase [Gammaproteobacteria bacterium]